jgi:hypothetical protein
MAVGIRPNVALAKKIGLQVDKAILVNDTLQTFDPCIYAVGECVQHRGACLVWWRRCSSRRRYVPIISPRWASAAMCKGDGYDA